MQWKSKIIEKLKMKFIMVGLVTYIGITAQTQVTKVEEPKGKATVQMFGNFQTGSGSENDNREIELGRSYFDL